MSNDDEAPEDFDDLADALEHFKANRAPRDVVPKAPWAGDNSDLVALAGQTTQLVTYAAGREQHRLQHLRERRVRRVQVRSSSESPPAACLPDIGKTFAVGEAPFLPHRGVDCRCTYMGAPRQDALP